MKDSLRGSARVVLFPVNEVESDRENINKMALGNTVRRRTIPLGKKLKSTQTELPVLLSTPYQTDTRQNLNCPGITVFSAV